MADRNVATPALANKQNELMHANLVCLVHAVEELDAKGVTVLGFTNSSTPTTPQIEVEDHPALDELNGRAFSNHHYSASFLGCRVLWVSRRHRP